MSNPWLKKNPFMSMWLSAANEVVGAARSQVSAEAKRQLNASVAKATDDNLKRWLGTPVAKRHKAKAKSPRR